MTDRPPAAPERDRQQPARQSDRPRRQVRDRARSSTQSRPASSSRARRGSHATDARPTLRLGQLACRTSLCNPDQHCRIGGHRQRPAAKTTDVGNAAAYVVRPGQVQQVFRAPGRRPLRPLQLDYQDPGTAPTRASILEPHRQYVQLARRCACSIRPRTRSIYAAYGDSLNPSAEFRRSPTRDSAATHRSRPNRTRPSKSAPRPTCSTAGSALTGAVFRIEKTNLRIPTIRSNNTGARSSTAWRASRASSSAPPARSPISGRCSPATAISNPRSLRRPTRPSSASELPNTPRNNFTLWTTYDVTPQWTVGGGAIYQSTGFGNTTNTALCAGILEVRCDDELQGRPRTRRCSSTSTTSPTSYYAQYYQRQLAVPASGRWASLTVAGALVRHRARVPQSGTVALRAGGRRRSIVPSRRCRAMMVHIPNVLTAEQVARCREVMEQRRLGRRPRHRRPSVGAGEAQSAASRDSRRKRASSATWCCRRSAATRCSSRRCCRSRSSRRCSTATTPA